MKSDIQLYPDLIKALEKNEIVYLFGAGFSTALSGRKYTWWDWIVDGIGRMQYSVSTHCDRLIEVYNMILCGGQTY